MILCVCQYLFACVSQGVKRATMCMYVLLAASTGLLCAGTGEVQLPRVLYTLGGNAIRGAGTGDLFTEHREEHQTQKRWDYQKMKGQKEPISPLSFSQLLREEKGEEGGMTQS